MRARQIAEREAEITELMQEASGTPSGSWTARELAFLLSGLEKPPRSWTARVTQSLRVMERDGIVKRDDAGGRTRWRLA